MKRIDPDSSRRRGGAWIAGLAALGCLLGAGCGDPVIDAQRDALPDNGVHNGPTHRGGQPCLLCHSDQGSTSPTFVVAGTIYRNPRGHIPADNAMVQITDSRGESRTQRSNCAGNFYITSDEWEPRFPLRVELLLADGATVPMLSKIAREGACSSCHAKPAGPDSAGDVFLDKHPNASDVPPPDFSCFGGDD